MNDIKKGVPRCRICFTELPCREHPSPPNLTFVGGTQLAKPSDTTPQNEQPHENSSLSEYFGRGVDDGGWPARDSPVATDARGHAGEKRQEVHPTLPGPVHVPADKQGSTPSAPQDNVVPFDGKTKLDHPPEFILQNAIKENLRQVIVLGMDQNGNEYFAYSTGDIYFCNWLVDRAKLDIHNAFDDESNSGA